MRARCLPTSIGRRRPTLFDPLLAPGGRNYWKSNNFSTLTDAALDVVIACAARLPGPECEVFVAQLGGAMGRVKPGATAFVGRDTRFIMNVHGRWSDARDDERVRAWARQAFADAAPHATAGGYVNFLTDDEAECNPIDAAALLCRIHREGAVTGVRGATEQ